MSSKDDRQIFACSALISLQHVNLLSDQQKAEKAFALADEMMRLHDDGCPHHDDEDDDDIDIDAHDNAVYAQGEADGKALGIAQGRADLLAEQAAAAVKPDAPSKK